MLLVASAIVATFAARPTLAADDARNQATIRSCILAAADAYRQPPAVLVILLNVEGGSLGAVSQNTNGTVDIGPMQVNQIWMPDVAAHWRTTERAAFLALRDNFCANVEAGALDSAPGPRRGATAISGRVSATTTPMTRGIKRPICRAVLKQVLRLRASWIGNAASHPASHKRRHCPPIRHRAGGRLQTCAPQPHPRASWPSNDDNAGFYLIVILVGVCLGAYLLWMNYHGTISAAVMAVMHREILLIDHFTHRFDVADRQMAAADPNGVTLRDLYGIAQAVGMFFRIPATVFIVLLAAICTVRAAPSRYKRGFDLDALIREQALAFRSTAAFVRRHLRLVPPPAGAPRPADYALTAEEWIDRFARNRHGAFDEGAARAALAAQLGARWKGPQDAAPVVRCLFAAFALHLAQRREEALDLLGDASAALAGQDEAPAVRAGSGARPARLHPGQGRRSDRRSERSGRGPRGDGPACLRDNRDDDVAQRCAPACRCPGAGPVRLAQAGGSIALVRAAFPWLRD